MYHATHMIRYPLITMKENLSEQQIINSVLDPTYREKPTILSSGEISDYYFDADQYRIIPY
jgi:hypothetical protein